MNNKLVALLVLTIVVLLLFGVFLATSNFNVSVLPGVNTSASKPANSLLSTVHDDPDLKNSRICNQCVGGKFLEKKWLMQDDRIAQKMSWFDTWTGTDCLEGIVNYYPQCHTSCVTIWIQEKTEVSKAIYDSILMDCADDLISNSPDIPREGFKDAPYTMEFKKNETFYNERTGFRITYEFSTASSKDANLLAIKYRKMISSGVTTQETETDTKLVFILISAFVVVSLVIGTFVYLGFHFQRQRRGSGSSNNVQGRRGIKQELFNLVGLAPQPPAHRETREIFPNSVENYQMSAFPHRGSSTFGRTKVNEVPEEDSQNDQDNFYEAPTTLQREFLEKRIREAMETAKRVAENEN
uniref:CUB domain-containing protein n=1 Tax=Caenorhabditis tropicalis TaxID=1561998 RepID=A0A1I7U0I1_9PELO